MLVFELTLSRVGVVVVVVVEPTQLALHFSYRFDAIDASVVLTMRERDGERERESHFEWTKRK